MASLEDLYRAAARQKLQPHWLVWHGTALEWLAVLLVSAIAVASLGLLDWSWMSKDSGPAWVQAVGSVLAIVVAIGVASKQSRELKHSGQMALAQRLDSVAALVEVLDSKSFELLEAHHPDPERRSKVTDAHTVDDMVDQLIVAARALEEVKLDDLHSEQALLDVMDVRSRLKLIVTLANYMRSRDIGSVEWNAYVAKRRNLSLYAHNIRMEAKWVANGYPPNHRSMRP